MKIISITICTILLNFATGFGYLLLKGIFKISKFADAWPPLHSLPAYWWEGVQVTPKMLEKTSDYIVTTPHLLLTSTIFWSFLLGFCFVSFLFITWLFTESKEKIGMVISATLCANVVILASYFGSLGY